MEKEDLLKLWEIITQLNEESQGLELSNILIELLYVNMPFKNEKQKKEWLEELFIFTCWEDFNEKTKRIINNKE